MREFILTGEIKMKTKWIIGGLGVVTGIIIIALIIMTAIFKWSWLILLWVGIVFAVMWFILGIILLVKFIRKTKPVEQVDLNELKNRIVYEVKYDDDNPDNFVTDTPRVKNIGGASGTNITPIYILRGYGSEMRDDIFVTVNLNKPQEINIGRNLSDIEKIDQTNKTAESPPLIEVHEEIPGGLDPYGRPLPSRLKITKQSSEQIKKKEEEEKAEERVAQ